MLKCDFHMHAREDPLDWVTYTARELIEKAAQLEFNVLAFTFHGHVLDDPAVTEFARRRGILLIRGCEVFIGRREVLCFNITQEEVSRVRTFEALREWKRVKGEQGLVIAPHPFYPLSSCLREQFHKHLDLWDAVEYCHMHTTWLNYNRPTERIAAERNIPIVGTSDAHEMFMFGRNYTLVDAEQDMVSVFRAIRAGRVRRVTPPLSLWRAVKTYACMDFRHRFAHLFSARDRARWRARAAHIRARQAAAGKEG